MLLCMHLQPVKIPLKTTVKEKIKMDQCKLAPQALIAGSVKPLATPLCNGPIQCCFLLSREFKIL